MNYTDPLAILRGIIVAAADSWPIKMQMGKVDFPVPIGLLMASADEIARLRDETERLRREVALLRAGGTIPPEADDEQADTTIPHPSAGPGDPGSTRGG